MTTRNEMLRDALNDVVGKMTWRPDNTAVIHDAEAWRTLVGYIVMATNGDNDGQVPMGVAPDPWPMDVERLRDWWDSLSELDQFNAYRIEKSNADALRSRPMTDRTPTTATLGHRDVCTVDVPAAWHEKWPCLPDERHTFPPSATHCFCGALRRPPVDVVEVTLFTPAEARASLDVERLLPFLRHTNYCVLRNVRDNAPWDEACDCGLAALVHEPDPKSRVAE